jgi:hypothetical protein
MTDLQDNSTPSQENPVSEEQGKSEKWPEGTSAQDHICWVCNGPTLYRQCKIICKTCGFMRDCSDP